MRTLYLRSFLILIFVATACDLVTPTLPAPSLPPTSTVAPKPTSTHPPVVPSPTVTIAPSATPNDLLPLTNIKPDSFTQWHIVDPADPTEASLIAPVGGAYQLDPTWEVSSIEYVYKWWGLAEPVFNYQAIEKKNGLYLTGSQTVDPQSVQSFLASVSNLYPSQALLAGNDHTDDYPAWALELTSTDGRRVELFSSSTANPDASPWNVLNNGRLYAQYDGTLGKAISNLFSSQPGQPAASFYPGGREPGTVIFGTQGYPLQLDQGFTGLLPIADGFSYTVVSKDSAIRGYIEGRLSIGGMGNMVIGTLSKLDNVTLTNPTGIATVCSTKSVARDDPAAARWTFECLPGPITAGQPYKFGLKVELRTSTGSLIKTLGTLRGIASEDLPYFTMPIPEPLEAVFETNPDFKELLANHSILFLNYSGSIKEGDISAGAYTGELTLAGEAQLSGHTIRYTVSTPFDIQRGQLTNWDLTQTKVNQLLSDVFRQPMTQQVYQVRPSILLHLWYAETGQQPNQGSLINYYPPYYQFNLSACGASPAINVPDTHMPLRAFSFSHWDVDRADYLLVNNQLIVNFLDLDSDLPSELIPILVPRQLHEAGVLLFPRALLASFSRKEPPELTLNFSYDPTEAELAAYNKAADAIPVTVDRQSIGYWTARGVSAILAPDGQFELVACN